MPEISFQNLLKIEKRKKIVCVKLCRHRLIYFYLESLLLFVITSSKLECSKIHNCSYSVSFQCDKNKIEMTIKMCLIMQYFFRLCRCHRPAHKGLNSPKRFTNLPLGSMSSIQNLMGLIHSYGSPGVAQTPRSYNALNEVFKFI